MIKIYNLLLNNQQPIRELLSLMGVTDLEDRIKKILDTQLFEVLECTEYEILKIRNKNSGEILQKGTNFYVKKYDKWRTVGCFDNNLTGDYTDKIYYKNYIRTTYGSLYHLNDISLTDVKEVPNNCGDEITLNGITYIKK